MANKIFLSKKAEKFLESQEKAIQERIKEILIKLIENPFPVKDFDIKKIQGLLHTFRIRIGDIRLIYEYNKDEKEINVLKIDYRGSVYKNI